MDTDGDSDFSLGGDEQVEGEKPSISDVIEAISLADPDVAGVSLVQHQQQLPPSGGSSVQFHQPSATQAVAQVGPTSWRPPAAGATMTHVGNVNKPCLKILEQPASKATRFRYECEGRSAGSILGVHSTSERRSYPTIQIQGFTGDAHVMVSCVYKDPEPDKNGKQQRYRTHPHNLVGRELCQDGTCQVNLSGVNPVYSFANLGVQCVKRKAIEVSLKLREEKKIDPFKVGFDHKKNPQSIDLNAVRLCFQGFLLKEDGNIKPLQPVVSDVIYDKKALSDLAILRVSHCAGPVSGGTEMILLCEKVMRDEIVVVFYEEYQDSTRWEAQANVLLVHRQYAIVLQTPPYKDPNSSSHHKVFIQLRRRDDTQSVAVPFEYTPRFTGTVTHPPEYATLTALLNSDTNNNKCAVDTVATDSTVSSTSDTSGEATLADVNGNICDVDNERSLNELLDQVAELDEIYSENRTRLENVSNFSRDDPSEDFNDAGTYTSLQLAFKNPITIAEPEPYEDVQVQTYRGPIIEFTPLKPDNDDRAPPLPPKRAKKTPSVEGFKTSQTSVDSILRPGKQLPVTRNHDVLTELSTARSEPALPPAPKKRSFLSRLFRRRDKSPAPSIKSEGKKEKRSKPMGRSVSSVSGQRPSKFKSSYTSLKDTASGAALTYADSVTHISLHGDGDEKELKEQRSASSTSLRRPASLAPLPPTDGGTILVAESVIALDASAFKKLQDDLDLTEAEHYALYMAVAPHATASEFDDTSCYYSPVDGNKFHDQN